MKNLKNNLCNFLSGAKCFCGGLWSHRDYDEIYANETDDDPYVWIRNIENNRYCLRCGSTVTHSFYQNSVNDDRYSYKRERGFNLNFKDANDIAIFIGKNMKIIGKIIWQNKKSKNGYVDWDFHPHFHMDQYIAYSFKFSQLNDIRINAKGFKNSVNFSNFISSDSVENIKLGFQKFVKNYESLLLFN